MFQPIPILLVTSLSIACASASAAEAPKTATFQATNEITLTPPKDAKELRAWIALPQDDAFTKVANLDVKCPVTHRVVQDSEGCKVLYVEAKAPFPAEMKVVSTFDVTRTEQKVPVDASKTRAITAAEKATYAKDLAPNANVVIDAKIQALAKEITGTETNPVKASRKIYDWVLANVDYWVKDPATKKASPVGSSEYCLTSKTGNCTDFHSLYAAISRAAGIPTRFYYGSFFKQELDGQDTDQSYHCWLEFYAPEIGWVPIDVAIADIFVGDFQLTKDNETLVKRTTAAGYTKAEPSMVDYYFGNLEERRVLWSLGRDLTIEPAPKSGKINALPKALVEIDGAVSAEKTGWTRKLTYKQKS
jgi:transglutaminase-like putative cysteine protease